MTPTILAFAALVAGQQPGSFRIDEVARGRFAPGLRVTRKTADQDLLVVALRNDGRRAVLTRFDPRGRDVPAGAVSLDGPLEDVRHEVRSIGWTQLTSVYLRGPDRLDVLESLLTPVVWFRTERGGARLLGGVRLEAAWVRTADGWASPLRDPSAASPGRWTRPYLLAVTRDRQGLWATLWLFHQRPVRLTVSDGLELRWAGAARFGALPVFGARVDPSAEAARWVGSPPVGAEARLDRLARSFWRVPVGLRERWVVGRDRVSFEDRVEFLPPPRDPWGWSRGTRPFATLSPALVACLGLDDSIRLEGTPERSGLPGFLSEVVCVPGETARWDVPKPDLYGMLLTPDASSRATARQPEAVREAMGRYRAYVRRAYSGEPRSVFGTSAIGEGRWLTAEYPMVGWMGPEERRLFDRWADWAIDQSVGNRQRMYAWRKDASSPLPMLLDNYRIAGKDFVDAGWFGYNVTAAWCRGHYGRRWDDVRRLWPLMRDLFYGWNWVYGDWAVGYAPLYVEGEGGNPKGFTDNMAMLQAAYAWARMAERLGDERTLRDALGMLVRERIGRLARTQAYRQARSLGFRTLDSALVSDQGTGPSLSPATDLVEPRPIDRGGLLADYGESTHALWFLTGSFFEPPSFETLDLLRLPKASALARADAARLEGWLPRWWSAPGSGETTNYQLFWRTLLLGEGPGWAGAVSLWQDSVGDEAWEATAFHGYGFLGIALSAFEWAESRRALRWERPQPELEAALFRDDSGRRWLWVANRGDRVRQAALRVGLSGLRALRGEEGKVPVRGGRALLSVRPGVWIYGLSGAAAEPIWAPRTVCGVAGGRAEFPVRASGGTVSVGGRPFDLGRGERPWIAIPPDAASPFAVRWTAEAGGARRIGAVRVFPVPRASVRLVLDGPPTVQGDVLATGRLRVVNREREALRLVVSWRGGGDGRAEAEVPAGAVRDLRLPLEGRWPDGEHRLEAEARLGAAASARAGRRVLVARGARGGEAVTAYGFEIGKDRWNAPGWADGNQDGEGRTVQPEVDGTVARGGSRSLRAAANLAEGRFSQLFWSTPVGEDWSRFARVRAWVFLPAGAPEGLLARVQLTGADWKYREFAGDVRLVPGEWTEVSADLAASGAPGWGCTEGELASALRWVVGFGFKVHNEGSLVGYRGPVYLDDVQLVLR
ncbi:MAG: hypothetical protein ACK41F_03455 [Fimbriimonadaceae bacterium]